MDFEKLEFVVFPDSPRDGAYLPDKHAIVFGKQVFNNRVAPFVIRHELAHCALEVWIDDRKERIVNSLRPEVLSSMPGRLTKRVTQPLPSDSSKSVPGAAAAAAAALWLVAEIMADLYAATFLSKEVVARMADWNMERPPRYGKELSEAVRESRSLLQSKAIFPAILKARLRRYAMEMAINIVNKLVPEGGDWPEVDLCSVT